MSPILLLGQLLKTNGPIRGRKKLQKIVHLLQTLGRVPFGYSYQFSFFGPYSADLKADVDALAIEGLVQETNEANGTGFQTYVFSAGEKMERLLNDLTAPETPAWATLARELNGKAAAELEGISTIAFLQKMGWSGELLEEQFKLLKPRLAAGFTGYCAELTKLGQF